MTRKIAVANQKGGVGKTTFVFHSARAACRQGYKVLLIDMDPQGNLTSSISGDELSPETIGLADALSTQTTETLEDVVVPSIWEGVDLIPTTGQTLPYVRNELIVTEMGAESRLKKALQGLEQRYDLILIDCPPSIDQLTINAMVAADSVLVITQATRFSLDGINHLLDSVELVREHYNPGLVMAGLILNQYDRQLNAAQGWRLELQQAAKQLGLTMHEPVIPKRTVICQTVETGEALDQSSAKNLGQLVAIYDRHIVKIMGEA